MITHRFPAADATNSVGGKKRPVAILDACVLIPMPVADTLLRMAEPPSLFEAWWTDEILAEVTRTLVGRFGKSPEKARYREAAMRDFFSRLDRSEL